MEQYFSKQDSTLGSLYFIEEKEPPVEIDGVKFLLEMKKLDKDELSGLDKKYTFVRMATDAIPVFKKI